LINILFFFLFIYANRVNNFDHLTRYNSYWLKKLIIRLFYPFDYIYDAIFCDRKKIFADSLSLGVSILKVLGRIFFIEKFTDGYDFDIKINFFRRETNDFFLNFLIVFPCIFTNIYRTCKRDKNVLIRNVNVIFTPLTYILHLLTYFFITNWIPLYTIAIIFDIKLDFTMMLVSTFCSLFIVISILYGFELNTPFVFENILSFISFLWCMEGFNLHNIFSKLTRKVNPFMLVVDHKFVDIENKTRLFILAFRYCLFVFIICLYHLCGL